ncbi:F-box/kelch-repeat protein At2g43270-like [Lotus japonicus]|uniref:F-box/kelch-repeat protein At2g43270-like n=1 Tax=Lotus japonicus TaxID=34305 RepID=UPI002583ABD2|nr:F-box/kelch-repeat protein At2g43270-like [Lotus japonicus]
MAPPTMEIHDDIAFSILSKLPLKSLKRFTCAHKTWAHLLENPHFMAMFRANFLSKHHSYYDDTSLVLLDYRREPHLLLGDKFENKVKLDWPYLFSTVIVGCGMHGIFCLDLGGQCELWNPATKELRIIPPSPLVESQRDQITSSPFVESQRDQITSATAFGFGYDNLNDDFKVIRLLRFFPYLTFSEQDNKPMIQEPLPCLEIYSLRSNSWRKLDIDRFLDPLPDTGGVSYLNGMCHWLATGYENHHKTQYLVSFNMSSEILFTTPLPLDMGRVTKFLVVLNGSIAVILRYGKTYHISILCELGVKESWTKLFTFECLLGVRPIGVGKEWLYILPKAKW